MPRISLATASGQSLRPAPSRLLLSRFLPTNLLKKRRRFLVSLPKSSRSLWEQHPLASGCLRKMGQEKGEKSCTYSVRLVGFVGKDAEVKTTKTQREFTVLSCCPWRRRRLGRTRTATATSGEPSGTNLSLCGI